MTELIATLSSDGSAWPHVKKIIEEQPWEKVFLVTSSSTKKSDFKSNKEVNFIVTDINKPVAELIKDITIQLKEKIKGMEIALNLVSGTGKEHMSVLSAIMKLGLGFRLIAATKEGIVEI